MKKMKKLFSKIVTLVLLVAMLIPYTSIPKVEAEETCADDNWEYHTNYYFFLAAENPFSWLEMFKDENKAVTYYSTEFLYTFPNDGRTIDFDCADCSSGFVEISKGRATSNFDPSDEDSRQEWTTGDFYTEIKGTDMENVSVTDLDQYIFTNNGSGTENDRIITYLFHGNYSYLGANSDWGSRNGLLDLNEIDVSDDTLDVSKINVNNLTNASIEIDKSAVTSAAIGTYNGWSTNNLKIDAIEDAINSYNNTGKGLEIVTTNQNSNEPVIKLVIKRQYSLDEILKSGATVTSVDDSTGSDCTTNADETETCIDAGKVTGRYNNTEVTYNLPSNAGEAIGIVGQNTEVSAQKAVKLSTDGTYASQDLYFLAPTLYQMSYRVCKTATPEATEDTVSLTYKSSKEGAVNLPEPDTKAIGSKFTVSTQEPTLSGYKFSVWSTDPECGNSGRTFEPGTTFSDSLTTSQTLYACWGSTNGEQNKDTGVLTYAGLFTGIIALAGGSYYLLKKKNVFKKI